MRNLEDGEVDAFGAWVIQVQGHEVFVIGRGCDLFVHGSRELADLIEGLRSCVMAIVESENGKGNRDE